MKKSVLERSLSFFKREIVLCVSVLLALISCFFVPPGAEYISYIDWDTLALLFSLMAVMKGLQGAGFFVSVAGFMLKKVKTTRTMLFILVFMPFFTSMVITNDVALITFVPFGLTILGMSGQERLLVPQVVLQTLAANLGSMLTPMGNPQNLYLYNSSSMSFAGLCGVMLPYVLLSAVCLAAAILFIKPIPITGVSISSGLKSVRPLAVYGAGFLLCLLGVFKVLPPLCIAGIAAAFLLFYDRKVLAEVDYSLLGTFFAFFIFVGNISKLDPVREALASALSGREALVSVLTSQVISNVPAALLLSGFSSQWRGLIIGCNLGGLGTLIASMASLISYKQVAREHPEQLRRYFLWFTISNVCLLALLFLFYVIFEGSV